MKRGFQPVFKNFEKRLKKGLTKTIVFGQLKGPYLREISITKICQNTPKNHFFIKLPSKKGAK